jgi:hypothetical protein
VTSGGPQSGLAGSSGALGGSNPLTDALNGLLHANPFSSTAG